MRVLGFGVDGLGNLNELKYLNPKPCKTRLQFFVRRLDLPLKVQGPGFMISFQTKVSDCKGVKGLGL